MKNACIILKTEKTKLSKSDFAILDDFTASGYYLDEIRVFCRR